MLADALLYCKPLHLCFLFIQNSTFESLANILRKESMPSLAWDNADFMNKNGALKMLVCGDKLSFTFLQNVVTRISMMFDIRCVQEGKN